jgi:uncharacterized protein
MKQKVLLLVAIMLFLPLSALAEVPPRPTTDGFVFDYQNVIDDEIEQEMNDFSFELQRLGIMELFIITVPTIGDLEAYEYGVELFRQWGIGDKEKNNGMVIFATTDMGEGNNKVRIATGYGLEGDYPDGYAGELIDTYMVPYLEEGDYTTAFAKVVEAIRENEGVAYEWQQAEVFEPVPLTWVDISFFTVMVAVALALIVHFLYKVFRFVKRIFYSTYEKVTGKDIRSKRYKAYLLKEQEKEARRQARYDPTSPYYDPHHSSSSDSYSGGGGDSGGGGSDRSF